MKKRRKDLGLTLEDVAKIVGVTRQTIQKYESGVVTNIPSDKIELIATALKTTPAYLMGWEEEKKEDIETIAAHALRDLTEEEIKAVITLAKHIKSEK